MENENKLKLSFIYRLNENPIYSNCDYRDGLVKRIEEFERKIKVAIVGFNEAGQKFLDTALQVCQMPDRELVVSVYSSKMEEEKQAYLKDRPAFVEYFDIDDINSGSEYGHISFKQSKWKDKGKMLIEFFDELVDMDYVIFAEDKKEDVEELVKELLAENPLKYQPILLRAEFIDQIEKDNIENIVNQHSETDKYTEFERMAFNAHIVWSKTLEIDLDEKEEEFLEEYNYVSSFTYVLSIKYKLHSIGVELDFNDVCVAAEKYIEQVNGYLSGNENDVVFINKMTAAEHRRWNVDKTCSGWQTLKLEDITTDDKKNKGKEKDNLKTFKHHYCLVKGGVDNPLANWSANDWECKDISELDDLDKVSVKTHRVFLEKAKLAKDECIKILDDIVDISKGFSSNDAVVDWSSCAKVIIESDSKNTNKPYLYARNRMEDSLKKESQWEKIASLIDAFDDAFSIILKSREFDNQKQKDIDLVLQIPFILTYDRNIKIASEFIYRDNSELFANISLLKKFNPKEITYFCESSYKLEKDIEHFVDCIADYDWLKTKISFVIGFKRNKSKADKLAILANKCNAALKDNNRDTSICFKTKEDNAYYEYITSFKDEDSSDIDLVVYSNSVLGYTLKSKGISCGYYVHKEGTFDIQSDIRLRANTFYLSMTIQDVLRINGASGEKKSTPIGMEKYSAIYNYKDNKKYWKSLCKELEKIVREKDYSLWNEVKGDKSKGLRSEFNASDYSDLMENLNAEFSCLKVEKKENKERLSGIVPWEDLYNEIIKFAKDKSPDKVQNIKTLWKSKILETDETEYRIDNVYGKYKSILDRIEKKDEIKIEVSNGQTILIFKNERIKSLLTKEGEMLETIIYNQCVASDLFDDVATGYEITWENSNVTNEFDILLTKGLKCAFVECKSTYELKQVYYEKLESLDCKFGINSLEFIVNDSIEMKDDKVTVQTRSNRTQIARGNQFEIQTILPTEIDKAAKIISKKMK